MRALDAPHVADLPELAALLDLVAAARGAAALSEHKRLDLARGDAHVGLLPDPADPADPPATAPDGLPAAYAHLARHGAAQGGDGRSGWGLELVLHPAADPAWRDRALAAALDAVAARGGGGIHWWVAHPDATDDAAAAAAGFVPDRDLLQLRCALPHPDPVVVPDGVRLRAFVPGADDDAWLAVNRLAFATHPEQGAVGPADLAARVAEPWFDAEGFVLAEEPGAADLPGALAGFCWTKRHPPDPADPATGVLGEIYVIGVHPSRGGRGLGRVLVLAGLDHLARTGARTGMLFVDGDNASAVALYEKLGFHRHAHDRAYLALV
jgi:mycothiol synthase